ncbi:MAG TPA: hypothetical protein EYG03_00390 [Planctomycetes bacterium]|nr:hypothetical protein [Planctomycetota bacterium]
MADELGSTKTQRIRLKVTDTRGNSDIDFTTVSRTGHDHGHKHHGHKGHEHKDHGPQPPKGPHPHDRK